MLRRPTPDTPCAICGYPRSNHVSARGQRATVPQVDGHEFVVLVRKVVAA